MHTADIRKRLASLVFVAAGLVFTGPVHALRVTPGSECEAYCMDAPESSSGNTTTIASDIVCSNEDFWSTATGTKYRNCVNCLQNSTATNGSETDTEYYMYNVRYALDVCLYSFPSADAAKTSKSSKCASSSSCLALKTALETGITEASNETQYDYCTANNSAFSSASVQSCQTCLASETNMTYLSNFLTALDAGCKQQPPAGDALGLNSTLFTTAAVGIITPSWWNQAKQTESTKRDSSNFGHALAIGIAIGCAIFFALALGLFYWLWRTRTGGGAPSSNRRFTFLPLTPGTGGLQPYNTMEGATSGGYAPFYTTDYKRPLDEQQRNVELYEKIKTQHIVVPARQQYDVSSAGMPMSSVLWGRDTPMVVRKQIEETQSYLQQQKQVLAAAAGALFGSGGRSAHRHSSSTASTASVTTNIYHMGQGLDEMPTHPAFMPRAFTRPSRNPVAMASETEPRKVKSNKPDAYAAQHYLAGVKDISHLDLASLLPPPSPPPKPESPKPANPAHPEPKHPEPEHNTRPKYSYAKPDFHKPQQTAAYFVPHTLSPILSPEPTPRSVADTLNDEASILQRSRSISPNTVPILGQPGPLKQRAAKRNVPPPIDIAKARAKATRVDEPQTDQI